MGEDKAERRWRAMRGLRADPVRRCPQTSREQLAALAAVGSRPGRPGRHLRRRPVAALEERVAGLLGKPAAAFFPTGTMAQQVALRCWAERSGNWVVAMHPLRPPGGARAPGVVHADRVARGVADPQPRQPTARRCASWTSRSARCSSSCRCATPATCCRPGTS